MENKGRVLEMKSERRKESFQSVCFVHPAICLHCHPFWQTGPFTKKEQSCETKGGTIAKESALGVRTVHAFNGQEKVVRRYEAKLRKGDASFSDCGKSTTVGLLKWLHEREGGTVMIDASNVRDLNIEWIRNIIAVVQLEPVLFSDTVEVILGSEAVTRALVRGTKILLLDKATGALDARSEAVVQVMKELQVNFGNCADSRKLADA
uniref:ABC transporter domain-containing protein n=1 Tax=Parascaris univalens TaxID=6257 RepID=A0A915BW79_PARUN